MIAFKNADFRAEKLVGEALELARDECQRVVLELKVLGEQSRASEVCMHSVIELVLISFMKGGEKSVWRDVRIVKCQHLGQAIVSVPAALMNCGILA